MSSARLSFLGASEEVTGSSYMIESDDANVLVDCGMHQGPDADSRNAEPFPFAPAHLDAVLLTHAHIDHSGRLPLLVKQGFKGKIYCTEPTADLLDILLRDTARLMAEDAEWRNRKAARRGLPAVTPLFAEQDVIETLKRITPISYDERLEAASGIFVRYRDAGHICGAAIVEVWIKGIDGDTKIVFSGDLGPLNQVVENPPTMIEEADYVVIESTYGDRAHKPLEETREEFRREIARAITSRGKILVPTFVVDRAQRVLYELLLLQDSGAIPAWPPIYFDSPMGSKTTRIYEKYASLLSPEIRSLLRNGRNPFEPRGLTSTSSIIESRAINDVPHAIVLAGSGMCAGGRIVHHLKHNLWQRKTHVFFVGYQASGTLGRRLVNGEKSVRIAGEDITVAAMMHTIGGFSAHGDRNDLLQWASHFPKKAFFFVTHGERNSCRSLAAAIRDLGYESAVPSVNTSADLLDRRTAIATTRGPVPSIAFDREAALSLLDDITAEALAIRGDLDESLDYASLRGLLESSRLILRSVRNMK